MKIKLLDDIWITGSHCIPRDKVVTAVIDPIGQIWMAYSRQRPLDDHEWEIVLEDADLDREFPQVKK